MASHVDADVAHTLEAVLGWPPNLWRAAFVAAPAFALLVVAAVIVRPR